MPDKSGNYKNLGVKLTNAQGGVIIGSVGRVKGKTFEKTFALVY
ncbi:MAG TPA: hypothetical protein VJ441_01160 [Dehalococcoidia bacterium]|nr:hypothetical protein [Dehalococcoidia bacterium]